MELIVTASGKSVAPAPLEDGIREHPLVGHGWATFREQLAADFEMDRGPFGLGIQCIGGLLDAIVDERKGVALFVVGKVARTPILRAL